MRGINYVTKQLNGDASSSADEEQDDDADAAAQQDDVLDEDGDNKSLTSPQSPKVKGASTSSAVKKKAEIVSFTFMCNNGQCIFG